MNNNSNVFVTYNHPYKKFKKVIVLKNKNNDTVVLNVGYLAYALKYRNKEN